MQIGVGYIVTETFGEMEKKTLVEKHRRTSKKLVGYFQSSQ